MSIKRGSELLGYSEQAYHKGERTSRQRFSKTSRMEIEIKTSIEQIRKKMPRIGGEKLWIMTALRLKSLGLEVGRDKFVEIYKDLGFIVKKRKKRKKRRQTTDSSAWQRQWVII